ncbi:MAG: hypothetical protein EOP04_29760 [Proteobacteria bacterium]|nr:MAG: hypothetical protein EOP04_29760 [Pseudomonadota bacterium]
MKPQPRKALISPTFPQKKTITVSHVPQIQTLAQSLPPRRIQTMETTTELEDGALPPHMQQEAAGLQLLLTELTEIQAQVPRFELARPGGVEAAINHKKELCPVADWPVKTQSGLSDWVDWDGLVVWNTYMAGDAAAVDINEWVEKIKTMTKVEQLIHMRHQVICEMVVAAFNGDFRNWSFQMKRYYHSARILRNMRAL